jgi:hypothetical protein
MNAKLKASQLVNRFYNLKPQKMSDYSCILWPTAKECARIAVDEIINLQKGKFMCERENQNESYWQEVKQEIDNL